MHEKFNVSDNINPTFVDTLSYINKSEEEYKCWNQTDETFQKV